MVRQPQIFLMDEPLSNLDATLRISMRAEIKQLHQAMQTTFVYVTHDQAEALTLADRIVVMKAGVVQQIGQPDDIYERPTNMFVAGFLGNPAINFIEGRIESDSRNGLQFVRGGLRLALDENSARMLAAHEGCSVTLGLRAEDVSEEASPQEGLDALAGRIVSVLPIGSDQFLELDVEGCKVFVRVAKAWQAQVGSVAHLRVDRRRMHLFDPATQKSLIEQPVVTT
jgi:multiple sugar transport system ATP-binding protein